MSAVDMDSRQNVSPESFVGACSPLLFSDTDSTDAPSALREFLTPWHVQAPPIEAVVFAWGVNEDFQLGMENQADVHRPKGKNKPMMDGWNE